MMNQTVIEYLQGKITECEQFETDTQVAIDNLNSQLTLMNQRKADSVAFREGLIEALTILEAQE